MEEWFLLYDGSSVDGRGSPDYFGRTKDRKLAMEWLKERETNPYSIARVMIITDTEERYIFRHEK